MVAVMEEREDTVVLTDEDGEEHEFELLDVLEVEGRRYAVLVPSGDEDEDADEAVILRLETDPDGKEVLVQIEDDEEWERVADAWDELLEEEGDDLLAEEGDDD